MPKQGENATATDSVSIEVVEQPSPHDPTIDAHLENLRELAVAENADQRKVLAAGTLREGVEGERVLTVHVDGSYEVTEEVYQ